LSGAWPNQRSSCCSSGMAQRWLPRHPGDASMSIKLTSTTVVFGLGISSRTYVVKSRSFLIAPQTPLNMVTPACRRPRKLRRR
jgi:hypothetical protein